MQRAFYFDQTRCTGCYTCVVACKDWHDVPAGPASWMRVSTIERGDFPNLFVAFGASPCYHCAEPICAVVCPAQAISKREDDGVVVVDKDKCREAARCGIITEPSNWSMGERQSPCEIACPAHLNVPGYVSLIAKGKFREAIDLIRQRMPIPSICGRVCNHPCETVCKRQDVDEPVSICSLRRFVADLPDGDNPTPVPRTHPEKVAIIGSGPAGLSAAYDLVRLGYGVTVFEALPEAGGMLTAGIPEYRLPRDVVKRDIEYIKGLGVEIKTGKPLGPGMTLDDLGKQGYEAVFIAVGAHQGSKLNIPGTDLEGVLVGTSFLRDVNLGKEVKVGKKVLVLGGGNVAIDCARVAKRLGAAEVQLACLECREDMPAFAEEIKAAEEEGIVVHPSRTFTRLLSDKDKVSGAECQDISCMEFDSEGKLHCDIIEGSEHVLPTDMIILAVGQTPDLGFMSGTADLEVTKRGTIAVDNETLETSRPGVFAGGDAISGTGTVIEAIAAGQRAAVFINRYLNDEVLGTLPADEVDAAAIKVDIPADIEKAGRQKMPSLPTAERIASFAEVNKGFTEEMAIAEAERCLNCAGSLCLDVCPYEAPQFGAEPNAKMQKCDFCLDRWEENKPPICVAACPLRALDAGPLDEMKAKHGDICNAEGFVYSEKIMPSIVFKPKLPRDPAKSSSPGKK